MLPHLRFLFEENILDVIASFPAVTRQLRSVDDLDERELFLQGTPDLGFAASGRSGHKHIAAMTLQMIINQHRCSAFCLFLTVNVFAKILIDQLWCPAVVCVIEWCFFVDTFETVFRFDPFFFRIIRRHRRKFCFFSICHPLFGFLCSHFLQHLLGVVGSFRCLCENTGDILDFILVQMCP